MVFELAFPATGSLDAYDLSAVTLRSRIQGNRWVWSSTFERVELHHDHGPSMSFGVGAVFGS